MARTFRRFYKLTSFYWDCRQLQRVTWGMLLHQTLWQTLDGWDRCTWGWELSKFWSRCRRVPRCRCSTSRLCSPPAGGLTWWRCTAPQRCQIPRNPMNLLLTAFKEHCSLANKCWCYRKRSVSKYIVHISMISVSKRFPFILWIKSRLGIIMCLITFAMLLPKHYET